MVSVESDLVDVEERDEMHIVALNRPEKMNALNVELTNALYSAVSQIYETSRKGLLLTGRGDATCAGADIDIVKSDEHDLASNRVRQIHELYHLFHTYPRPTVMACKGAVVGAAFQFAISCDFAVIGEETKFAKIEMKHGIWSGYPTKMLEHLLGPQITKQIVLTGDFIPPERALSLGLVVDVVPEHQVDDQSIELLEQLVDYDNEAYETAKESLIFEEPYEESAYPSYP